MEQHEKVIAALGPVLAELGYNHLVRVTLKDKGLLSVRFCDPNPEHSLGGLLQQPSVEVYVSDMWPNERGEIFLHVWNWIGMAAGGRTLAEFLKRKGFAARWTTHRRTKGVRVKLPGLE